MLPLSVFFGDRDSKNHDCKRSKTRCYLHSPMQKKTFDPSFSKKFRRASSPKSQELHRSLFCDWFDMEEKLTNCKKDLLRLGLADSLFS